MMLTLKPDACSVWYEVSFAKVRSLIGMGGDQLYATGDTRTNERWRRGKVSERRKELMINHYGPTLPPAKGARRLFSGWKMTDYGWLLLVQRIKNWKFCSSLCWRLNRWSNIISDAEASKPAPDIVEAALSKLEMQLQPSFDAWWYTSRYSICGCRWVGVV